MSIRWEIMMQKIYDVDLHYEVSGTGDDLILLHGWGQNSEMMKPLADYLQQWFRVWNFDLPGFAGKTTEPPFAWDIYDYTVMLSEFIAKNNIVNPTLIGHSFGGRMCIVYASKHADVKRVVLLDAAGVKPKRSLDYYTRVYSYKLAKHLLSVPGLQTYKKRFMKSAGSSDYQNASPVMKEVLRKVVNEDLQYLMSGIVAPTLLIWGANDEATPVSDAKIMEQTIPNAGLVVLPGVGHYAYLEALGQVQHILYTFLVAQTSAVKQQRNEDKA